MNNYTLYVNVYSFPPPLPPAIGRCVFAYRLLRKNTVVYARTVALKNNNKTALNRVIDIRKLSSSYAVNPCRAVLPSPATVDNVRLMSCNRVCVCLLNPSTSSAVCASDLLNGVIHIYNDVEFFLSIFTFIGVKYLARSVSLCTLSANSVN